MTAEQKRNMSSWISLALCTVFLCIATLCYNQSQAATQLSIEAMKDANDAKQCATEAVAALATHVAESKVASDNVQKELVEIKTDVKEQRADVRQLLIDVGQLNGE
jgi:hypothetical protein